MDASFVSKARTAFHSAAAKAEKVFTDIKKSDPLPDLAKSSIQIGEDSDQLSSIDCQGKNCNAVKSSRERPAPIKVKQDWQERFKNLRLGRRGEKTGSPNMAYAIFDENIYLMREREFSQSENSNLVSPAEGLNLDMDIIPPTAVMKQLTVAVEASKQYKSMKDLLVSSRDSSPVRERAGLGLSAVKSLVLREKEDKLASEFGSDEKVLSLINSLIDAEGHFPARKADSYADISLPKDIHGAPVDSLIVYLSEAIGRLKTLRKMASFWYRVVAELRRLWAEGRYIPGIPQDEIPDLNCCLLYQQLQVMNCCVSRKKRRSMASESLDSVIREASSITEISFASGGTTPVNPMFHAKTSTGELVLRLGADKQSDIAMLETGEPVYAPVMQEGPLLTEDLIKETEELVLRTGSVGAGCSQLLSDMQAFKAANPGCILEDFIRWHSPPDWMEKDPSCEASESSDGCDLFTTRGQLSTRMQKEGNLWRELWETAKPVPAVRQTPLFDEDLAVEGILDVLEDILPSDLFEQLFLALLGSGFVIAEATLSTYSSLSKLFYECKDYIVATCQSSTWVEKVDDICQVYETMETMLLNPDEVIRVTAQPEEATAADELKNRFKRLSFIFGSQERHSGKKSKEQKTPDEKPTRQPFSSIFSKKPPKPNNSPQVDKPTAPITNDWTIV